MLLPKQVWKDIKGYEISNVSMMLKKIDEDEKIRMTNPNNVCDEKIIARTNNKRARSFRKRI